MDPEKLRKTVVHVQRLLVNGDYGELERVTGGSRLSKEEMEEAVADYGRQLVMPPEPEIGVRSIVQIQDAVPPQWSIYVDLWTKEEGRSDLTLEITLSDLPGDLYAVEVDGIHVL